ncbi:MAG TPA: signal peptidase II [Polyangiaceae bacterium]
MTDPLDPPREPALSPAPGLQPALAVEPVSAAAPEPTLGDPAAFPAPQSPEPATLPSAPPAAARPSQAAGGSRPTFLFFGVVAAVALLADVGTKAWAEITLSRRDPLQPSIELIPDHLSFTLAYNPGGAWGLFQNHSEYIRRPFFLLVSLLAIGFIINLYGRLTPQQHALKWGLPLVLGGALGNLSDRIVRSNVIDFIDYQAKWIEAMNRLVAKAVPRWSVTEHWPTFNVADIAICVGVGLMAVDMFTSRRGASSSIPPRPPVGDLGLKVPDATPPLKPEA